MVRYCGYYSNVSRRKRRKAYPVKAPSYPFDDKRRRHSRRPCEHGDTSRSQTPPDASHGDSDRVYLFSPPPSGNLHGTPGRPPSEHFASAGFPCGSLSSPMPLFLCLSPRKRPWAAQVGPDGERTENPQTHKTAIAGIKILNLMSAPIRFKSLSKHRSEVALGYWPGTSEGKAGWDLQPALCDASARSNVTPMVFPRRLFCPRCGRRQRMWSSRSPRLVPIPGGFRSSRPRSKAGG